MLGEWELTSSEVRFCLLFILYINDLDQSVIMGHQQFSRLDTNAVILQKKSNELH